MLEKILKYGLKDYSYENYNCHSKEGKLAGRGYVFEDLAMEELRKRNLKVERCEPIKNGIDFIVEGPDGKKVNLQLKCYHDPSKAVERLVKKGEYQYPNQIPFVPKGQREIVERGLAKENVKVPVYESKYSYQEISDLTFQGLKTIYVDLKRNLKSSAKGAFIIGLGVTALYLTKQIFFNKNENKPKPESNKKIVKSAFKCFSITFVTVFGAYLIAKIVKCQNYRPRKQ